MNHKDEKFDKLKRWVIGISGVGMAIASIILSKQGVGITGDLAWIGTVVALSLFCAELMFNSNFDELNWTILFLGLGAYIYSIWTNIQGFYFYREIEGTLFTNFDTTSFFGGVFMDVYPELAIAWAMGASKIGDLIGNVVKTSKDPDKLTQAKSSTNNTNPSNKPAYQNPAPRQGFKPAPKPYPTQHKVNMQGSRPEPSYHPVGMQSNEDDDEMMSRAA
jgi:hypothetical protein